MALRFPQDLDEASPVTVAFATTANAAVRANTQSGPVQPAAHGRGGSASTGATGCRRQLPAPQATMQMASAEPTAIALPQPAPAAKRPNVVKPVAAAVHNRDDRATRLMLE